MHKFQTQVNKIQTDRDLYNIKILPYRLKTAAQNKYASVQAKCTQMHDVYNNNNGNKRHCRSLVETTTQQRKKENE